MKQLRFYVSGRLGNEQETRAFMDSIRGAGGSVPYDWTIEKGVQKPYLNRENLLANRLVADKMRAHVMQSDALVLLYGDDMLGAYIELGMALGAHKPVIVVGAGRSSLFYSIESVLCFLTPTEALAAIKGMMVSG